MTYDPFAPGQFTVNERSMQAFDAARNRSFPCDIWRPTETVGICPIILLSHSSGDSGRRGCTSLASPDVVHQIGAVVALAPGGSSNPRPGILPAKLTFKWGRDVPTLLLVADNDVCLPIDGMYEIFERIPAAKRMVILRRADHMHFMDNVEQLHEAVRSSPPWIPELDYLQKEMLPIAELCTGEQSHLFVRGLTLAHFDAVLKQDDEARRFLAGNVQAELASRGVEAFVYAAA